MVIGLLVLSPSLTPGQQGTESRHVYAALYERGPAWITGKSVRDFPNFQEHVAHIRAIESSLLGAGPFVEKSGETSIGMVLFLAANDEDAAQLAGSDPFVQARYTRVTKVLRWDIEKLKSWP